MSSATLFVRNKTDEFIGQVSICRENVPDKLIIVDYTRDNNVFKNSTSKNIFTMKCDHPKFTGFTKYLHERKKAAVIKLQKRSDEKDVLFILPPTSSTILTEVSCLLSSDLRQDAKVPAAAATASATAASAASVSGSSGETPKHTGPPPQHPPARPSTAAPVASRGGNFLTSLLSKVEADVVSYTKAPLIRSDVLSAVEKLQTRVRDALLALELEDEKEGGRILVAFEPMEPEQRYLVHEVIDEFENLVGQSQGEDIDRHVVAYKKGFEPVEETEETAAAAAAALLAASRERAAAAKRRAAQEKRSGHATAQPPANFVKVSSVKRDRRTIEDYQNDKKRKL